jgi:hypothetical protein
LGGHGRGEEQEADQQGEERMKQGEEEEQGATRQGFSYEFYD